MVFVLLLLLGPGAGETMPAPPSCATEPTRIGGTIQGTPCADVIVAPPGVETVNGGGGNDTIVPAALAAGAECPDGCFLGVGSQTFNGGPGDDTAYGERGNDTLNGGGGDDHLFGGIGDDLLRGGPGDDQLSGGFGADSIAGEADDDYIRGDATADRILDGGSDRDILSFATGVTPGFTKSVPSAYAGFPSSDGERGVYLDLGDVIEGKIEADNGVAPNGGGVDGEIIGTSFEVVIGTPFSDYIAGSAAGETIHGGGGADVILGKEGNDTLYGGVDGDDLDGGEGVDALDGGSGADHCQSSPSSSETSCATSTTGVAKRDQTKVSVGLTAPEEPGYSRLYLTGSETTDSVTVAYLSPTTVTFTLATGSFDSESGGCAINANQATCSLSAPLDSVVTAGMGGDDTLLASSFPSTVSMILSGGEGEDALSGGDLSEDVLVDGPGKDTLKALGGDDALLNNGGADELFAGAGSDLFLSNSICDGDKLNGGPEEDEGDRDNASWAKFQASGVEARLDEGKAGRPSPGGPPDCSGGSLNTLQSIEDLEGTPSHDDVFYGDAGKNQLLGWGGADSYFSEGGADTILANSGDADPVIDCGEGADTALIDRPPLQDVVAANCETVREADPNSFRVETELPAPTPPAPAPSGGGSPSAFRDARPPRTRIAAHPRKVSMTRRRRLRVVFRFSSSEAGGSFRCRLDGDRFAACSSPRAYLVAPGRHTVRIVAVDPAGNPDPTPALFGFRVRRR